MQMCVAVVIQRSNKRMCACVRHDSNRTFENMVEPHQTTVTNWSWTPELGYWVLNKTRAKYKTWFAIHLALNHIRIAVWESSTRNLHCFWTCSGKPQNKRIKQHPIRLCSSDTNNNQNKNDIGKMRIMNGWVKQRKKRPNYRWTWTYKNTFTHTKAHKILYIHIAHVIE